VALAVERAPGPRMQAAPAAVAGVFEGADLADVGQVAQQRVAVLAADVLEEDQLLAAVAVERFHGRSESNAVAVRVGTVQDDGAAQQGMCRAALSCAGRMPGGMIRLRAGRAGSRRRTNGTNLA